MGTPATWRTTSTRAGFEILIAASRQRMSNVESFLRRANEATAGALSSGRQIAFDIGSRDLTESIALKNYLPPGSEVYAFECNEATLGACRERALWNQGVYLVEKAVADYDGVIPFYPIDPATTRTDWPDGNPGASSLFKANGKYEYETYGQTETTVPCVTLKTFCEERGLHIDILWMDVQGAELMALRGAGDFIKGVKAIHVELTHREMYTGQAMADEVHDFLTQAGFVILNPWCLQDRGVWQVDGIYVRKDLVRDSSWNPMGVWSHL